MRFYPRGRLPGILLPVLALVLSVLQVRGAILHPSAEHTMLSLIWCLVTVIHVMNFPGTYWKLTPQGLLESRGLFARRVIPYNVIQGVSQDGPFPGKRGDRTIKISLFMNQPLLVRPAESERFVSSLEQHLIPSPIRL